MDDLADSVPSTGCEPLFIKEEERDPDRILMEQRERRTNLPRLTFTGQQLKQSASKKPHLQEMDELLKSCEDLTGIPFGSDYTPSYSETSLCESSQAKEEVEMESYVGTSLPPQAYLSTSYIDTHMDGAGIEDQPAQDQSQSISRCGATAEVSRQTDMPLTTAGSKLSETMVEYEGQLVGMLAMLESCMEEAGMDFEPQDWATDDSQEYVHISKNPHHYRGTTLVPIQQERPLKLEPQTMQVESWAGQHVEGDEVSKDSGNTMTVGLSTNGSQQNPLPGCDNMGRFSVARQEGNFNTDQEILDLQFRFPGSPMQLDGREKDQMYCEGTVTGQMFNKGTETKGDVTGIEVDDTESEEGHDLQMDTNDLGSGENELGELGSHMEDCIEEVQQLEKKRKELLVEVLKLRGQKCREEGEEMSEEEEKSEEQIDSKVAELMNVLKREKEARREERKRDIQSLMEERAEEERKMWKVNLERQGLQEELRKLKRRLFAMLRDCAYSQAALNNQRREVELHKTEEEKLHSLVLQLTEEGCQLRSAQQQQLLDLRAALHAQRSSLTSNTQEELTEYRRHSCGDIQQYLQGGLKALEDRYEPILLALLKRREAAVAAQVKAKEQAQELKAQLGPLKEEMQKLKLEMACLEEKLKLIHIHRREDIGQYKETVYFLEESSKELKMELKIQKRKTKEIEEMRDSLTNQLMLYRAAIEDHNKCDHEEKT